MNRGFITASCSTAPYGFVLAFFEWIVGSTYPTITQLAWSGSTSPSYPMAAFAPNTSSGTQSIFLQIPSSSAPINIQARSTSACSLNWSINLM